MSWHSLPTSLKLFVLSSSFHSTTRRASNWSRHSAFPAFFTRTPVSRFPLSRKVLWLLPVAGGLTLYLAPTQKCPLPLVLASPTLIPCSSPIHPTILSPAEPDQLISSRIIFLLRDNIWEPIFTASRFIYLFILFMPVIVSSPMLLVGVADSMHAGDRWGAIWWYNLLARRMEAAGPTFIKVRFPSLILLFLLTLSVGTMGRLACRFISYFPLRTFGYAAFKSQATRLFAYQKNHRECISMPLRRSIRSF
jgi:hypothetical protein